MRRIVMIFTISLGAIAGYFAVVFPMCFWFFPGANTCGVFFPFGMAAGGFLGYWIAAPKRHKPTPPPPKP